MRKGIGCAVVLVSVFVGIAGAASADMLCVPSNSIPGCPSAGGESEPTIADAVANGHSGDTILIAADSYNNGHPYDETVSDSGTAYHFVGAGQTKTIIQAQGTPGMNISAGSTVTNLAINLYDAAGETGLMLAGSATEVTVTATGTLSATDAIGVDLSGGSFSHGTVALPVGGSDDVNYGGVIGSGTLSDSSVTAAVGITSEPSGATPTVHRARILANRGVLDAGASPGVTIDDTLIRTLPGAASQIGFANNDLEASESIRHVDIVGSGAAGSVGVEAESNAVVNPTTTTYTIDSSIVRGYAKSVSASAIPGLGAPDSALTAVNLDHSFYDSAAETVTPPVTGPPAATATVSHDSHSGNFNPLFVNQPAGDFQLQAGSPAIDAGSATLASGESTTDLNGNPRQIAGRLSDGAISDVGAYEFRPHAPAVSFTAGAVKIAPGKPDRFHATGSERSPGDAVSFQWSFGDGGAGAGASVSHAFARAGSYRVTVTAVDLDRFTATASIGVTVPGPSITKLAIKPDRFRAGPGAAISYRASQAATASFKVLRGPNRKLVGRFKHHGREGKNRFHWSGEIARHALSPGSYVLVATPRDRAGTGRAVKIGFTIRG